MNVHPTANISLVVVQVKALAKRTKDPMLRNGRCMDGCGFNNANWSSKYVLNGHK
jgi:hypothetical protein